VGVNPRIRTLERAANWHRPVASALTFRRPTSRRRPLAGSARDCLGGILGTEKIGIEDDFFELGGDSVLATQVVSRLRDMFRMDLPPIVLFEAPTIETLATYMIANEARPGLAEKTAGVLKRIEGMTEEEVTRSLHSSSSHTK